MLELLRLWSMFNLLSNFQPNRRPVQCTVRTFDVTMRATLLALGNNFDFLVHEIINLKLFYSEYLYGILGHFLFMKTFLLAIILQDNR